MIFPELKEIYSREIFVDMDKYIPEYEDFFEIELTLIIGIRGQDGGDIFYLNVCSPKWISELYKEQDYLSKRGYLVIEKYDFFHIKEVINKRLHFIFGSNWIEIVNKINLFAIWEFDNYQDFIE